MLLRNWHWAQSNTGSKDLSWTACHDPHATTSQIHVELMHAHQLADPFRTVNEAASQWVSDKDWAYTTEFLFNKVPRESAILFLQGLDCHANVYLNNQFIHANINAWHTTEVDISDYVNEGKNTLLIIFKSDRNKAKSLELKYGKRKAWNGDPSRVYARKPQYQWGWDWGPTLITSGITLPLKIQSFQSRIIDLKIRYELDHTLQNAHIQITYELEKAENTAIFLRIYSNDRKVVFEQVAENSHQMQVRLENVKLWYPHKYRPSPQSSNMYHFTLDLISKPTGKILDHKTAKVGFRKVELVQEALARGQSFFFVINEIPIYCSGFNWIPAHSFNTSIRRQDYTEWMDLILASQSDMIRVWGGGSYESDQFYDECDERGILVWQDFMFACAQYPAHEDFLRNVKKEAHDQLRRLQHHPSIVIYAGNNEDYQIAEAEGLGWDPNDANEEHWSKTEFPARLIYEKVLPDMMKELKVDAVFHPGSPWKPGQTRDPTRGDSHVWDVWHGSQLPYQSYDSLAARFISEFGMQALPSVSTTLSILSSTQQAHPQSREVEWHNKADSWERRLALYILENVRVQNMSLEEWTYLSQLVQSEAITYALRNWRRRWGKNGQRLTAGALVWQLNDCWPCTSWALVDFYKRPKLAYHALTRESGPISIGMKRNAKSLDVWIFNSCAHTIRSAIEVTAHDVSGRRRCLREFGVELAPNQVTTVDVGNDSFPVEEMQTCIFKGALKRPISASEPCEFSRTPAAVQHCPPAYDWPQPLKYLDLVAPQMSIQISRQACNDAKLESDTVAEFRLNVSLEMGAVKGLEIYIQGDPDARFSNNGFDLVSEDEVNVQLRCKSKLAADDVHIRYYGCFFLKTHRPTVRME